MGSTSFPRTSTRTFHPWTKLSTDFRSEPGGLGPARPEASRATEAPLERMRTAAPSASVVGLEGMALASCVSRA